MHDSIVRPYGGDFLVVIMLYCIVKSFSKTKPYSTGMAILVFAYVVEVSQYFHLVNRLGLQQSSLAKVIIGTSFAWTDLLAYTLGMCLTLLVERRRTRRRMQTK
ncbi:ribosomal maturation YjgA family protein [Mucilaginibacter robiniae]|nr:DUF2809 domain-containing protein [Mucilaginibacter robiniae]